MNIPIQQFIFAGFAAVLIGCALMVITSRNSVRSALFLVLAFFAATGLWVLLEAEFLGLVLILVYVGAVMTLFLFVVMTLNIDTEKLKEGFVKYLPYGVVVLVILVGLMVYVINGQHFGTLSMTQAVDYSNTKALGEVLYTKYVYAFEIAGVLLLVAIIAAISLTFRGRQGLSKAQKPEEQLTIRRSDRIRIVKMSAEKKS